MSQNTVPEGSGRHERPSAQEVARSILRQLPLLVALVVLWMLLWNQLTVLAFVSGLVVAIVVVRVFPLPPVLLGGRFHVGWALLLLGRLAFDIGRASLQVSWQAVSPRGMRGAAIVAVPLRSRSDLLMTLTAVAVSLVPGSLVVEADRERSILYLHAIGIDSVGDVDAARRGVLAVETRMVRALGGRADVERLSQPVVMDPGTTGRATTTGRDTTTGRTP